MDEHLYNGYRIPTNRASWSMYSGGSFFITACTKDGVHYFGEIESDQMILNELGLVMAKNIEDVSSHYPYAMIPYSVVMPNHIHLYVVIDMKYENLPPHVDKTPLVSRVVNGLKGCVTKYANENEIPFKWQSRFYDHIIRDEKDADNIRNYILSNPLHWVDDKYHR